MTNTLIIIPVNQDTRPTEFYSAFETEDGVRVTMTIATREQGVANAITAKVETLGWGRAPISSNTPLWQIFLLIPFGLLCLWVALLIVGMVLNVADLMPDVRVDGLLLDSFDTIAWATKYYIRYGLISWLPLFAVCSYFELANRKDMAKATVS